MKIQASTGISLTGSSLQELVEGLGGGLDWAEQTNQFIGATQATVVDRGNVLNTLQFRVTRTHATPQEANLFYLDHPGSIPHVCALVFTILDHSGEVFSRRYMANAAVKIDRESWLGCKTVMKYHIQGGLITT